MPQPFTQFRPPPDRHVGLPRLAMPELMPCRKCGCLAVVGRLCTCERQERSCGADDPADDEDWRGELGGGDRTG